MRKYINDFLLMNKTKRELVKEYAQTYRKLLMVQNTSKILESEVEALDSKCKKFAEDYLELSDYCQKLKNENEALKTKLNLKKTVIEIHRAEIKDLKSNKKQALKTLFGRS